MTEIRRPGDDGHEDAPPEQELPQDELDRDTHDAGGDAPAAGTVEEREAVARDEDDALKE